MRISDEYLTGPKNYTDDWYHMRSFEPGRQPAFVCGASDAGVICGVSKYKTRLQLYLECRGLVEPRRSSENMEWGKRLEPVIMDHFRSETGFKVVIPDHLLMRRSHPMIGASPDGIGEDDEGARISIDAKCTTSRMYDPENCRTRDCFGEEHDEIPSDYVMQAQQQMLVVGADRCYFPVLFDGNKMRQYWVDADQRLQDNIVHNVTEFYNQVTNMNPPEPDFTHDTTVSLIKDMFGVDTGLEMTFSDDVLPLYERYVDAKQQIGAYTKIKDASQAALLFAMGEATRALVPGTGRQICRTAVDEKYWEQEDVDRAMEMLGEVKRKGYVRVTERKAK